MKGISPNFGHMYIWVHRYGEYIAFGVKGQGHSRQWPENLVKISQTNEANFTQFFIAVVYGYIHMLISLW